MGEVKPAKKAMKTKHYLLITLTALTFTLRAGDTEDLKQVAQKFVTYIDQNEAEKLRALLHPELKQFVALNGQIIPFKANDFVQMIADKKIGGVPRKVTFKSVEIVRDNTADVILNAVSEEYDFMYQLSLMKQDAKWIIVNITADIQKAG